MAGKYDSLAIRYSANPIRLLIAAPRPWISSGVCSSSTRVISMNWPLKKPPVPSG